MDARKNKIIHVFNGESYHHVRDMISETLKYFENDDYFEHLFYLYGFNRNKSQYKQLLSSHNDLLIHELNNPNELNKIVGTLGGADKLILHGFFIKLFWLNLLRCSSFQLNKVIWVCWGSGSHWLKGFNGFFINQFRKYLFKKFYRIITLMNCDYLELKVKFNLRNLELIPYYSSMWDFKRNLLYDKLIPYKAKEGQVNIMVGNSASATNLHDKSFQSLEKFKDERILIITPTAYGPENEAARIKELGKTIFGCKYQPFDKLIPQTRYAEFLSENIDILIYHSKTQTGLFNLYFGIYSGKKVYANGYNYEWISSMGVKINHVGELEDVSFEKFLEPLPPEQIELNRKRLEQTISVITTVPKWRELMYSVENIY